MAIKICEHNCGNVFSFDFLIRMGAFFRGAEAAGGLRLWHYDWDVKIGESAFLQCIGLFCANGGEFLTAWEDDRRPIAGMICEAVAGEGKARQVHFINALRPKGDGERGLLFEGARAGLDYAFGAMGAESLMGFIPVINQGALKFVESLGFEKRRIVKGGCYFDRLKKNMDAWLVAAERMFYGRGW